MSEEPDMLADENLEESCLSPTLMVEDLLVEYCLVDVERRLFIGVDARQSGRYGLWPSWNALDISCGFIKALPRTVVATLEAAMLSVLVVVDRDRDSLCRRRFLRGENEDWSDCQTSGAIAADMFCD